MTSSIGRLHRATFNRDGITYNVMVMVVSEYSDTGFETEIGIRLPEPPDNLADNPERLGELHLENGRRWLAYYYRGRFVLASLELTE